MFTNFSTETFTGFWDGRGKEFKPGASMYMPDYLAQHFAKHLTNRELLRTDKNGNYINRNGDKMTSPKFPEQVPMFMDLFNKAYKQDEEAIGSDSDNVEESIEVLNKNKEVEEKVSKPKGRPKKVEEEEFATKPV